MSNDTVTSTVDPDITEVDVVTQVVQDPELRKLPIQEARKAAVEKLSAEKNAPEATADAEGDASDTSADADTQDKPKKSKSGLERRFSELTSERDEARRKAQELEARLKELEASAGKSNAQADVAVQPNEFPKAKPKVEEFETFADYTEALTDWKLEKKEWDFSQRTAVAQIEQAQRQVVETWETREKAVKERVEGYDQLVDQDFISTFTAKVASRESMQYLLESEHGPALLYELAEDDAKLEGFKSMSPVRQVAYLTKLESKYEASTDETPAPKTTVSKAPPPPKELPKGKTVVTSPTEFKPGMSFTEYQAWRERQSKLRR